MNLSCFGGGLPESGCLFFKVFGISNVTNSKSIINFVPQSYNETISQQNSTILYQEHLMTTQNLISLLLLQIMCTIWKTMSNHGNRMVSESCNFK